MESIKGRAKAEKVYHIFQTLAPRYDRANTRISLGLEKGWKRLLIRRAVRHTEPGGRILDVCCGTGDIAIALAGDKKGFEVTGLDFSPAMLAEAAKKAEGLSGLNWVEGDAAALPFPDNSFSTACISFGLRNTSDYEGVLRQMSRVIRPGGRVFCLESLVPEHPLVRPFYRLYFRNIMPVLGGGKQYRKEYDWLYESTLQFPKRRELMKLFADAGLRLVQSRSRMFGACVLVEGQKIK